MLVNARHIKNVPGQKTDKKDSEWIAKLLLSGLLKGSFVSLKKIRELGVLHRHRPKLVGQRTAEKNRLQNVLEDANIKLASVVSNVFGKSGAAMIEAIIHGESNPDLLAEMAKGSLVKKKVELRKALKGRVTDHHRFMLEMIRKNINYINNQIAQLEARMDTYLKSMEQEVTLLKTIR
jgi:transposase